MNCFARHPFNAVKRAECQQQLVDLEGQAVIQENMGGGTVNTWGSTPNIGGIPINTTVSQTNGQTIGSATNIDNSTLPTTEQKSTDWSIVGYISLAVAVVLVGNYLITKKVK